MIFKKFVSALLLCALIISSLLFGACNEDATQQEKAVYSSLANLVLENIYNAAEELFAYSDMVANINRNMYPSSKTMVEDAFITTDANSTACTSVTVENCHAKLQVQYNKFMGTDVKDSRVKASVSSIYGEYSEYYAYLMNRTQGVRVYEYESNINSCDELMQRIFDTLCERFVLIKDGVSDDAKAQALIAVNAACEFKDSEIRDGSLFQASYKQLEAAYESTEYIYDLDLNAPNKAADASVRTALFLLLHDFQSAYYAEVGADELWSAVSEKCEALRSLID